MKHTIKVVQVGEGYVGYALIGNKAVYTTSSHLNPSSASNEVVNFIRNKVKAAPEVISNKSGDIDRSFVVPSSNPTPIRGGCCGRG
jgi:hypothetical protein